MSNINLTTLSSNNEYSSTYRDMSLDMAVEVNVLSRNLYRNENVTDLKVSKDEAAIQNSLINIFNTVPGQKLLAPEFGLDLRQYLFDPITEDIAYNIGDTILQGMKQWEPRVVLLRVNVIPDYDQNQYIISLYLAIPTLNISEAQYTGVLNNEGFVFKITDEQ